MTTKNPLFALTFTILFAVLSLFMPWPVGATGAMQPTVTLDGPQSAPVGDDMIYEVHVRGAFVLSTDARVEATLPDTLRFVRWATNPDGACAYLGSSRTVVCHVAEDALTARVVVRADHQPDAPTQVVMTARLLAAHDEIAASSTLITTLTRPDLSVGFAAPEYVAVGVPFRYGMRVQNTGDTAAPLTFVHTVLPRGLRFSGWIANPNNACAYYVTTHTVACELGTLEPKSAHVWVRFAVVATSSTARTRLVGFTQVTTTQRGDLSSRNNAATAQTWVGDNPLVEAR